MSKKKIIIIIIAVIFIVCVALFTLQSLQPKIISYTPSDGAENVKLDTQINLVFNRELNNNEKNNINVTIEPKLDLSTIWTGKQYTLAAKKGFKSGVKYQINVRYGNQEMLLFSFTTIPFDQSLIDKVGATQTTKDYVFGQSYINFLQQNPWYAGLPIDNSQYTVVYDFDKKQFRIRIKVATTDVQQKELINQALNQLKNIGVTSNPIPYYVLTP